MAGFDAVLILPCPFCGSAASLEQDDEAYWPVYQADGTPALDSHGNEETIHPWVVVCSNSELGRPLGSDCEAVGPYRRTPEEAAVAWNQRTPPPRPVLPWLTVETVEPK